ncbi:hypothetical protein N1851_028614 [Merluccius polli]|uniref:Uncharacterized protein n=1 Tax=Merluccius polli TaxID=89951 RepID=A0AA47M8B4_MERPO|nr:hypothetical protein N1851_028614 [Merluccius polli]
MSDNLLKLNKDKTEILLLAPKCNRETLFNRLGNRAHRINQKLKVFVFEAHTSKATTTAVFHLRKFAKVKLLDWHTKEADRKTSASLALCCQTLNKHKEKRAHYSCFALHRLPISFRIDFKVLLLTYKAVNDIAPS